jgi:uncharacterized cupin superfamily protein
MGKIDLAKVPVRTGSGYPPPHDKAVEGRSSMKLGDAGGLTQFGANLVRLAPGAKSSLRHWHTHEDEFVMVLDGTCTLIEDGGETEMQPGDCAAFPAGIENGHCLVNRTASEARFLVIGTRAPRELAFYSDIDMKVEVANGTFNFTRKDGSPIQG